jgi:4-coumarate--CoA ligase
VIASPDDDCGDIHKAFVLLKEVAVPDEIIGFASERVAPYKRIRQIAIIDAIPRSPKGKPLRRVLVRTETRRDPTDGKLSCPLTA